MVSSLQQCGVLIVLAAQGFDFSECLHAIDYFYRLPQAFA
jgi:hypothetical protein